MKRFNGFQFFLFQLMLLIGCSDKQDGSASINDGTDENLQSTATSSTAQTAACIGEWTYSFPFYSSELTIKNDGTFSFHEQGCMGHGYSEGKWLTLGGMIVLKSFERYAENNPIELTSIKTEAPVPKPKAEPATAGKKQKNGKIEYQLDPSIFNGNATYSVKHSDTVNVFFDNVQLRQSGNGLYKLDSNGNLTDTKYVRWK